MGPILVTTTQFNVSKSSVEYLGVKLTAKPELIFKYNFMIRLGIKCPEKES